MTIKTIYKKALAAAAFCAVVAPIWAETADAETLQLANCKKTVVAYESVSRSVTTVGAALYYPAVTMQAYAGCTITSVDVAFITSTSEGALRLFITKELGGEPVYEQTCTATASGWNTFELDTPYDIDGEALYIGYEVSGLYYLALCEQLTDGTEYVNKNTDGWTEYEKDYSFALSATVTGDDLPRHNVRLSDIKMPKYTVTDTAINYSGTFLNLGAAAVDSIALTYYVDGVATLTKTVSVDETAYRTSGTFSADGLSLSEEGEPEVYVEITAVNGEQDKDMSDNTSRTVTMLCRDAFTPRKILAEVFSTELCTNCAAAHKLIAGVFDERDDIIEVGHHAGYYTDPYTIDESSEYKWFYGTMVYAPAVMLDRTLFDNYADDYTYSGTPLTAPSEELLGNLCDEAAAVPAFVTVAIDCDYDIDAQQLDVTVSGEKLLPTDDYDNTVLNVFLLEDSIFTTTQRDTDGSFYHRYSIRQVLTATWGDAITLDEGYSASYSTAIADTMDVAQLYVVAFVANYDSDDATHCNVLNAEVAHVADGLDLTSIATLRGDSAPDVRVTSGNIVVSGSANSVKVTDMSGRCVLSAGTTGHGSTISTAALPHGIYIVTAEGAAGTRSIKFVK